jgi:hypothetical protein
VVVAVGGWVMEQVRARVKLVGMEVGLDGGRCGSATGRCSWWTRKMVGSLLWDILRGGLAWGQSPDRWRVVAHRDGGLCDFHDGSSRWRLASGEA